MRRVLFLLSLILISSTPLLSKEGLGEVLNLNLALAAIPNDPEYSEQWYLEQIQAPAAWDETTGSQEVIVAVLDAGTDLDHPDLADNLWQNTAEIEDNSKDDDHNGFIDDSFGWDFVGDDNNPEPDDGPDADIDAISHGTLIAGLVGAVGDNEEGVTGVAWQVQIMPLRMLDDSGSGSSTEAIDAIEYAVAMGAKVINLSFAGDTNDPALRDAVRDAYRAGVVIVAAMGNENRDTDMDPVFPACYHNSTEDWVIGVGSTDADDFRSLFSNFGSNCLDLSAPGEDIFGLSFEESTDGFDDLYLGGWSGTSMSSPLVAGAAALLLSIYPDLSPEDITNILKLSVDPINVVNASMKAKAGAGRLNLARALEYGAQFSTADETAPSTSPINGGDSTGISPVTGELEVITSVSAGDYIKSPSFSTVYYVTESGGRRAFIDVNSYFTWADSFDEIKAVTDATLSTLPLEGMMLPKSGVVLIKIQSDARVYALEENANDEFSPYLREITTELIAHEMYGANWADYVIDFEPTYFGRFESGEDISEAEEVDTSIMRTRQELSQLAQ